MTRIDTFAQRQELIKAAIAYVQARENSLAAGFEYLDLVAAAKTYSPESFANDAAVKP